MEFTIIFAYFIIREDSYFSAPVYSFPLFIYFWQSQLHRQRLFSCKTPLTKLYNSGIELLNLFLIKVHILAVEIPDAFCFSSPGLCAKLSTNLLGISFVLRPLKCIFYSFSYGFRFFDKANKDAISFFVNLPILHIVSGTSFP